MNPSSLCASRTSADVTPNKARPRVVRIAILLKFCYMRLLLADIGCNKMRMETVSLPFCSSKNASLQVYYNETILDFVDLGKLCGFVVSFVLSCQMMLLLVLCCCHICCCFSYCHCCPMLLVSHVVVVLSCLMLFPFVIFSCRVKSSMLLFVVLLCLAYMGCLALFYVVSVIKTT